MNKHTSFRHQVVIIMSKVIGSFKQGRGRCIPAPKSLNNVKLNRNQNNYTYLKKNVLKSIQYTIIL